MELTLANTTKNQHYLPQVEQRLNAANPNAPANRQRIYSFKVVDRERLSLQLESPRGRLISENLAIQDLFSFDVSPDKKSRTNFEALFGRYEDRIKDVTLRLLDRLEAGSTAPLNQQTLPAAGGLSQDLAELFTIKLLNFARNPHSIKKVLNTLGSLANYEPTSPGNRTYFESIINGQKPHQRWLCNELEITEQEYVTWLKMLFMLFVEYDKDDNNMLSGLVKGLFESTEHAAGVMVCTYDDPFCLVSDRAFSTNIRTEGVDGFDFNLCSRAFARFVFGRVDALVPHAPQRLIAGRPKRSPELSFWHSKNDLVLLDGFNRNVIYQSAHRVYSATKSPPIPSPDP